MRFQNLVRYFIIPAWKPANGINSLIADKHMLRYRVIIQLFIGIICAVSTYIAWSKGLGAVFMEPWLNIPAEDYFLWSYKFTIPVSFVTAIFASGLLRIFCDFLGGGGSFEKNFAIYVCALTLPTFFMVWLPDNILLFFF